ncbi:SulP family inorganic anion transporter [Humibacillus xanthopallidus]|uniref:SulP family sulfate permease n=1 Tax=Humibacillus xanthopallidus TaxID=412689 RepID=A0A543HGN9_9MICO|nr:SulP family inorganic anion transporter [Humibacillus xanthopallidus]TQM57488.1 SulP family sulfate permease [Humibacillus xanthopallidus]
MSDEPVGDEAAGATAPLTRRARREQERGKRRKIRVRPEASRRPDRKGLRRDATAGLVLGIESVPDGLASGLLAGVNPLAGLYAYLFGMVGAAFVTSSTFMAVQATGAMALVVADAGLGSSPDPERTLYTLAVLTGIIMIAAGLLRGGTLLRFVPTAVMTGFVTAVGVNIVLGQLGAFTGAELEGSGRVAKTMDLLLHPGQIDLPSLLVGVVTMAGIVLLQRTRLGAMGLVVAVVIGSALAAWVNWAFGAEVQIVSDIADVPHSLPTPVLPSLSDVPDLIVPALSLAFIGLVQGAAVSAAIPNPDGRVSDPTRDFVGQGVGNIVAGLFRGMPVGGSMSASALVAASGARSRFALLFAGGVMAIVLLAFADVVGLVAMPALAALLIIVGAGAIKPARVRSVIKTGRLQTVVLGVTFVLTLVVPVQYAVLLGVALAIVLHVVEQSNRIRVTRLLIEDDGRMREVDPPPTVPAHAVVVLQPYGSLFFASAPTLRDRLPVADANSEGSVVILRMRGIDEIGLSLIGVLKEYAASLAAHDCSLILTLGNDRVLGQLRHEGLVDALGEGNVYMGTEWRGETVRRAYREALERVDTPGNRPPTEPLDLG